MRNRNSFRAIATAAGIALLLWMPAPASAIYGGKGVEKDDVEGKPVRVTLHDRTLVDQDGRKVKFASEVVGDRLVVIDTFYTTCFQICPILSAIFMDLQDLLGSRQGKEVVLVSLSVDPLTDIPPRLKEYAATWNARPGWLFLGGEKQNVDRVLEGLGLYAPDFTAHPASFLVGDGRSGSWTRFYGFASPEQILEKIEEFEAARRTTAR
ncbi:MAG TPA: SCO family protein [Candidatus Deferrimicrobiaceae bacterium]